MGVEDQLSIRVPENSKLPWFSWKWSLVLAVILLLLLTWRCGAALVFGPQLVDRATERFHSEFNGGQFEEICREGDEEFSQGEKHGQLLRFLELVHRKLGNAKAVTRVNVKVNATTTGTFLTSQYSTEFDHGHAIETFTWRKNGSILMLYGYSVQSSALIN